MQSQWSYNKGLHCRVHESNCLATWQVSDVSSWSSYYSRYCRTLLWTVLVLRLWECHADDDLCHLAIWAPLDQDHNTSLYSQQCAAKKEEKTSCGAGHNKPRPLLPPIQWLVNASPLLLPSERQWLSELWPVITTHLTFDPPTRLPELTQNWIRSSHGHSTPSQKISCKSVQPFSRNVADKETKKERKRKKERNRSITIPRPPTGGGVTTKRQNAS